MFAGLQWSAVKTYSTNGLQMMREDLRNERRDAGSEMERRSYNKWIGRLTAEIDERGDGTYDNAPTS